MKRFVILGASNARRCLPAIVAVARRMSGEPVQIYGAIGHGRSYGVASSVLGRRLSEIVQSGIWRVLEAADEAPSDAVLIDIGNDILYGFSVPQILGWVTECVSRLKRLHAEITLTGLPMKRLERVDSVRFLLFRSILFPSSRLSLAEVVASARNLNEELHRVADEGNFRLVTPRPHWYGFDPIHIRFRNSREAWAEILEASDNSVKRLSPAMAFRLRLARPARESLFGIDRSRAQPALRLSDGSEISLY